MRRWPRIRVGGRRSSGGPSRPLTCRELVELVTDHFEGGLPPREAERFESHLSRCRGCAAYLAGMRRTLELLARVPEDRLPLKARTPLLHAFRTRHVER